MRHAARTLRKQRAFASAAVLMLGLGIGATTAIFTVVNGVLIKPLPYPDPDALVRIVHSIGGIEQPYFSDAIYLTYVDNTRAFQDVGVWSPGETATITGQGDPEEVRTLTASRGVLTTFGVRPEIGRWFSKADDTPGAPDAVMLANGYWHRKFGGDRAVLERALTINGRPHQIIGVMPAHFRFSDEFDVVLPLRIDQGAPIPSFRLLGVARLKSDVTLAQGNADAARVLHVWFENAGVTPAIRNRWAPALRPLEQDVIGDVGTTLWVLIAAIGTVLLMACANVANLLLVRADARRQEFAIRAALGAHWSRLARQLLVESVVLALLGGALGLALAFGGLRILVAIAPSNLPRLSEISIDPLVLGFALAISLLSGLLFSLIPILKYARPRIAETVGAGRGLSATPERQRSQQALVVVQVALALVLLVSAGLMIRSFRALHSIDPGFGQPERVQTLSISIPVSIVTDAQRVTRMQHAILDKIAAIPGVESVAFTTRLPMGSDRSSAALAVEGKADDGRTPPNRQIKVISPGVFRTLGTPLVAGRDLTWADLHDMRDVAIVSQNLARELWGSPTAALRRRIREYYDRQSPWREIVGVAGDVHDDGVQQPAPTTVYWPAQPDDRLLSMSGYQSRRVSIAIRSERAGTQALLNQVSEAVWSVSATLPLAQVRTLDEVYHQSMARTSFTLVMLAIAGTMALLLGVLGIYGVISYGVSQRRGEIGIRLALGAQSSDIRRLFVRRGLVLGAVGVALGLASAAAFSCLMRSLLFGTGPLDPITFAVMTLVLAAAAALASYLPARRAVAVDPVETLRAE
ncbi:MAG: multidrug ABC transporter substrate-binding protein [Acidobacteria bacterium]|nr:MAG: multidrug ABC transporter substrate-binding protein [Acidobacteriota bacterium]